MLPGLFARFYYLKRRLGFSLVNHQRIILRAVIAGCFLKGTPFVQTSFLPIARQAIKQRPSLYKNRFFLPETRVHGEFVIDVRRGGDPSPLLLSPMLGKLLVHEKCDFSDGA